MPFSNVLPDAPIRRNPPRWLMWPVIVSERRAAGAPAPGLRSEVVNIEIAQDPPAAPN
jgi:hypothetical protein